MPGSYARVFDDEAVLKLLHSRVKSAGSQAAFARQYGTRRTYLNKVLNGKKLPGARSILDALNLRIAYAPVGRRGRADARVLNDDDVRKLLHSRVKNAGGQAAFSKQTGVDRTHLNQVLSGKRRVTPSILDALNLRIVYTPVGRRQSPSASRSRLRSK